MTDPPRCAFCSDPEWSGGYCQACYRSRRNYLGYSREQIARNVEETLARLQRHERLAGKYRRLLRIAAHVGEQHIRQED